MLTMARQAMALSALQESQGFSASQQKVKTCQEPFVQEPQAPAERLFCSVIAKLVKRGNVNHVSLVDCSRQVSML